MHLIAIVSQKGGTGKTTTTLNLGAALAEAGKKVLLIDLDAQGSLSYHVGLRSFEYGSAELILREANILQCCHPVENFWVVPTNIRLADAELSISQLPNRVHILRERLRELKNYDFVLFDCPPSLSLITLNALIAAGKAIIPIQLEVLSAHGLGLVQQTIRRINQGFGEQIQVLGVLPSKVDEHLAVSREIEQVIRESFPYRMFNTRIRHCPRVIEAPSFAQSVMRYSPYSHGASDFRGLARELLRLLKQV